MKCNCVMRDHRSSHEMKIVALQRWWVQLDTLKALRILMKEGGNWKHRNKNVQGRMQNVDNWVHELMIVLKVIKFLT